MHHHGNETKIKESAAIRCSVPIASCMPYNLVLITHNSLRITHGLQTGESITFRFQIIFKFILSWSSTFQQTPDKNNGIKLPLKKKIIKDASSVVFVASISLNLMLHGKTHLLYLSSALKV